MNECPINPITINLILTIKGTPECEKESDFGEYKLI